MKRFRIRIISILLLIAVFICGININAFAKEIRKLNSSYDESQSLTLGETGGYLSGCLKATQKLYADRKFRMRTGHGFAAENGNNLYDSLKGFDTKVIGDNNVKNGADRIIFNKNSSVTLIQDKYYSQATKSVNAAFGTDGMYKYVDGDGLPMQLEVPADQYEEAVVKMKEKISAGKVKNITDPDEASIIVRKGKLTYKQAKNLVKAGNIDSLKYDAATGIISATYSTGISFAINFAIASINGEDLETACIDSLKDSIKTGAVVGLTHIIVSQLSKTKLNNLYVPAGKSLSKVLGKDMCKIILGGSNVSYLGKNVLGEASQFLAKEIHVQVVMLVVLSVPDIIDLFSGRISPEQLMANITIGASGLVGTTAGALGGAAIGSGIAPGIGTTIGGIVGGIIVGTGASIGAELLIDNFTESDAEKMCKIIQDEFEKLSKDYIVSKDEADQIVEKLQSKLDGETIKDIYESKDRNKFANKLLTKLFDEQIAKRKITIPSDEDARYASKEILAETIYIH